MQRVECVMEPKTLFCEILQLLQTYSIETPGYNYLSKTITDHYLNYENQLIKKLQSSLRDEESSVLDSLLSVSENNTAGVLSRYKTIYQSIQPKGIDANVKVFEEISQIARKLLPIFKILSLSPQCSEYYATWVRKAKLSQIKQFPDIYKKYLRLIAFIQYQYCYRQDIFVDILLRCVRSVKNTAAHQLMESDQLSRTDKRTAVRHLTKSIKIIVP